MTGITGTPGHICSVTRSMGPITSGRSGEGALGLASASGVTPMPSSASTRTRVVRVSSEESPGSIRQFTLARAVWGSAFKACPPWSIVATQVVRIMAL